MESSEAAKEPQTATDLMGELWEEEKGGVRVRDWRSRDGLLKCVFGWVLVKLILNVIDFLKLILK